MPVHIDLPRGTEALDGIGARTARRYTAIAIVATIHILFLWSLARIMPLTNIGPVGHELEVSVVHPAFAPNGPPPPPLAWTFRAPEEVLVPEPNIVIAPASGTSGGTLVAGLRGKLAPRGDPNHVNERPQLSPAFGSLILSGSLELHILVLPDGSVADARVLRSTGERDVDRLAVDWVEHMWHYLPASIDGRAIEAWTTVIVRFAPIH